MSTPSPHRIPRTEVELRDALGRFCETAWHPGNPVPIFSIPPQPADADIILGDGIEELVQLRAENTHLRHALVALMSAATALRHAQRSQPTADLTPLRAALAVALAAAEQAVGLVRTEAGPPDTAVPDVGDYATEIHFRGCRCQECGEMNSMEAEYDA